MVLTQEEQVVQDDALVLRGKIKNLLPADLQTHLGLYRKSSPFRYLWRARQEPMLAWEFVKSREAVEGRRILPEDFIVQYFAAREVVNALKLHFSSELKVDLLLKNTDNSNRLYKAGVDTIGNHLPEKYTPADIEKLLGLH